MRISIIQARQGDTWESLAAEHLGYAALAPVLREHNPASAPAPGQPVIIPANAYAGPRVAKDGYQTVPVLLYHQFSEDESSRMIVTRENFAAQMQLLADEGYTVVPLSALYDFVSGRRMLPPKAVVLTFDDGWQSFYDIAFPILRQHGYPATLFVYTDLIVGSKVSLSWEQIREMAQAGLDIQCHSRTHRNLSTPRKGESVEEFMDSIRDETIGAAMIIEQKTGVHARFFAYPYGYVSPLVVAMLQRHGFDAGFLAVREPVPFFVDPYHIGRAMVYGAWDIDAFRRQLDVWSASELAGSPQ